MQRLVGAALGALFGGTIGTVLGGQLVMAFTAGFGGIAGYFLVARFLPPLARQD